MDDVIPLDGGKGFGLLTRAQAPRRGQTFVLFNAGLIHRMGPFRLHVRLARTLAAEGYDVLRFDLPMVGDAPAGSHPGKAEVVREAMDAAQAATGNDRFIVGGICSAADLGWRTAMRDPRVDGLWLLDGLAVQNAWFRVGQLGLLMSRAPTRWFGMLSRFLRSRPEHAPGLLDYRDWPAHREFLDGLGQLLERGVRIFALYTGGVSYYLLHPRQLDATFGIHRHHPGLRVAFRPEIDHLILSPSHRDDVLAQVRDWAVAA